MSEQIKVFENSLQYYLKKEMILEKANAINEKMLDEEHQKASAFRRFWAIGGMVGSLTFGLPAINTSIALLRETVICFRGYSVIPQAFIDCVGVGIWILLNILFIVVFLINRSRI